MHYKQTTKTIHGVKLLSNNSNILSFDEVRSASRSRSDKGSARHLRGAHQNQQDARTQRSLNSTTSASRGRHSSVRMHSDASADFTRNSSSRSQRGVETVYARKTNRTSSVYRSRSDRDARRTSVRNRNSFSSNSSYEVRNSWDQQEEVDEFDPSAPQEKTSVRDSLRKKFRSAKAEKQFNRTVGSDDVPSEPGSRAALYEMRMGKNHRRTTEMQNGQSSSRKKKTSHAPLFQSASRFVAVGVIVIVFCGAFLYGPTADFYNETRKVQKLEAEYKALEEHNQSLKSEVDFLKTDEGLESYAREQYGLIGAGEHQVVVENVTSSVDKTTVTNAGHTVLTAGVKTPDTWYSGVLDVIFNYKE